MMLIPFLRLRHICVDGSVSVREIVFVINIDMLCVWMAGQMCDRLYLLCHYNMLFTHDNCVCTTSHYSRSCMWVKAGTNTALTRTMAERCVSLTACLEHIKQNLRECVRSRDNFLLSIYLHFYGRNTSALTQRFYRFLFAMVLHTP